MLANRTHFVCGLQLIFINTHLPNYLAICGMDPMLGATAMAIIGGINIVGCLPAGWLGQRYLKNVLLGLTYLARSAVGECLSLRPPMQNALFATIRDAMAPHYLGKPVDQKEALNLAARRRFASFGRAGTVMNALAAVDIALWAIAGKASGQSVSAMLGGARQRVEQALASGVASVKMHEASLEVIEEARRAIPPATPYVADSNTGYFATVEADHSMDLYGIGLTRWQKSLDVPTAPGPGFDPDPGFLRHYLYAAGT